MAATGIAKLLGALVVTPIAFRVEFMGDCCARLPIGMNKPMHDTAAKAH